MINRALLLVAMLASAGCLGSALGGNGDGGDNGGGGPGGPADMAPDIVGTFYANVVPILKPACGGCHGVAGTSAPAFMLDQPDMLKNLLQYPGIIGATPETSRLYMKGQHEGPAFTPDQAPVVRDWITFYNANKPMTDGGDAKPTIAPFTPSLTATNTIDLSALDATLTGAKITFTAKMVGTSIELDALTLVASASADVHVAHPLFVVWDQNLDPTPDPVDSFSNLDETVNAGTSAPLGPGVLLLPSYAAGSLLNVVFTTIEAKMSSGTDGGTTTGCKALTMFVNNVKPLLQQNNCTSNCHVGGSPTAGLKLDTTPDTALCQVVLTEINTTTPANSQLLQQPNPAVSNGHPQKINPFTAYQTAVTNWINAEK